MESLRVATRVVAVLLPSAITLFAIFHHTVSTDGSLGLWEVIDSPLRFNKRMYLSRIHVNSVSYFLVFFDTDTIDPSSMYQAHNVSQIETKWSPNYLLRFRRHEQYFIRYFHSFKKRSHRENHFYLKYLRSSTFPSHEIMYFFFYVLYSDMSTNRYHWIIILNFKIKKWTFRIVAIEKVFYAEYLPLIS